jgi:diaminopimelate decarboxylase
LDHFGYRIGELHAEDVAIGRIAAEVGTPVYVYASATVERHYRVFAEALADLDPLICFAVKANGNLAVVATLARLGAGADVVSGGELTLARAAGIGGDRIVFSGVGKTEDELALALEARVLQINVESMPELEALDRVARRLGMVAPVAIRINPDVDALTHAKISTGLKENKFGIEWTVAHRIFAAAARLDGIDPLGLAVHIGSQVSGVEPFRAAFRRLRDLVAILRADGHRIRTLDVGGGLGVPYGDGAEPTAGPLAYAEVVRATLADLGCRLIFEPGRLIVGNAGVLVTRVIYVKEGATRTFVIVDAGMNDLMRPALYGAFHSIVPVTQAAADAPLRDVDIVGPVCESSDTFAVARPLPPLKSGDLLALRTAGAYGAAMASTYNARPLVPEVLVQGDRFAVVRERVPVEAILARQHLPPWLTEPPLPIGRAAER